MNPITHAHKNTPHFGELYQIRVAKQDFVGPSAETLIAQDSTLGDSYHTGLEIEVSKQLAQTLTRKGILAQAYSFLADDNKISYLATNGPTEQTLKQLQEAEETFFKELPFHKRCVLKLLFLIPQVKVGILAIGVENKLKELIPNTKKDLYIQNQMNWETKQLELPNLEEVIQEIVNQHQPNTETLSP